MFFWEDVGWLVGFSHESLPFSCSLGSILIPSHVFLQDLLLPKSSHLIYIPELEHVQVPTGLLTWVPVLLLTSAYPSSPGFLFCLRSSGPTHAMIHQASQNLEYHPVFLLLPRSRFSASVLHPHPTTLVQPAITWVIAASHMLSLPPTCPPARHLFV